NPLMVPTRAATCGHANTTTRRRWTTRENVTPNCKTEPTQLPGWVAPANGCPASGTPALGCPAWDARPGTPGLGRPAWDARPGTPGLGRPARDARPGMRRSPASLHPADNERITSPRVMTRTPG